MIALMYIGVIVIGYVLGSLPFGAVISKRFAKTDLTAVGSGKTGMTNVLRVAGKKAAAVSLVFDILKGTAAVLLAGYIFREKTDIVAAVFTMKGSAEILAGFAAIAGHNWSVFLKFKGGRGVATFFGGLAAMYWPVALIGAICLFGIGFRTKYMSLGSIIGAVIAAFMLAAFYVCRVDFLMPHPLFSYVIYAMSGAIFIYIRHRDNILRLFNGTERKLGEKAKAKISPSTDTPK